MRKLKLVVLIAAVLVMGFALSACNNDTPAPPPTGGGGETAGGGTTATAPDEVFEFNIVHLVAFEDPLHLSWEYFANLLEERSEGRIEVNIFGNRVIGNSDPEAAEMVMQGIMHMTSTPASVAAGLGNVPQFRVFDFPYLFQTKDELAYFLDSPLFMEFSAELEAATGVRALPGYSIGWVNIMTTFPAYSYTDLQGERIRTMASDVQMAYINSLGASATVVPWGELFTAVQQGVVDGLITSIGLMVSDRFFEVCTYMIRSEAFANVHIPQLNVAWYNSLPADLQEIFDEAFRDFVEYARARIGAFGIEAIDILASEGVTIVEMDAAERARVIELTQAVFEEFGDDAGAGTVEAVQELFGR